MGGGAGLLKSHLLLGTLISASLSSHTTMIFGRDQTPRGYSVDFWEGCATGTLSETLTLYQNKFSCTLLPYSRLDISNLFQTILFFNDTLF